VVPPGVVVVPPVVPSGVVVVSEPVPPPLLPPPGVQADKASGRMAKLTAKALAQTVLDKLEAFIVVIPVKVVNYSRFLIFKFQTSRTILPSF
jgi:hypothetical protein